MGKSFWRGILRNNFGKYLWGTDLGNKFGNSSGKFYIKIILKKKIILIIVIQFPKIIFQNYSS